jgi:hypothetical protein
MDSDNQVELKLDELVASGDYESVIFTNLKIGDIIPKSDISAYLIDNVTLPDRLKNHTPGTVPLTQIANKFSGGIGQIWDLFERHGTRKGDITIIPYTKVFEEGIGQCAEKGILTQLCAQTGRKSYYLNGYICIPEDGIELPEPHGFNIIIKENVPHLIDVSNPLFDENGGSKPCIIPISDINEDGEIILASKLKDNRTYFLRL